MTIKDLAEKTGYALGTVSRALNGQPNVSERARKIILQTARECGFQLNANAKELRQQSSNTLLLITKGTGNELFGEMVEAIQHLVDKTAYQMVVDYMDEDGNEVLRAVQLCREKKPLGILFLGGNSRNFASDFHKIDVPAVLVTNSAAHLPFPNLSSVCTDDREAGRRAVETLIVRGHRQIVMIGGDRAISDTSRLRYEGCRQAMDTYQIAFDEQRDYRGVRYSYADGYRATMELLEEGNPFTALFAASDVMAIGAIRALWEKGLQVPEDVSVIGFDGLPVSKYQAPRLATVEQDVQQMARRSVEILLSTIEERVPGCHETVPFHLTKCESIASHQ